MRQTAALGYLCGVLWYLGNCYWIFPTMHIYGALASPVAAIILVLFAFYLGLYHALFSAIFGLLRHKVSPRAALCCAPFAWVAVELARARITGFPWDLLGYTQVDNSGLVRLSTVTGVMGLSLYVALVNSVWLLGKRRWIGALAAGFLLAVAYCIPAAPKYSLPADVPRAVLLQDNLSPGAQARGRQETQDELMADLVRRSESEAESPHFNAATVIVWPEAPADFFDASPLFRQNLGGLAAKEHAAVIADSIGLEPPEQPGQSDRIYNSASFFAPDGSYAGRYSKMHLVPFGEYTPYRQLFFFAGHLLDNVGQFTPGTERTLFRTEGHAYGVFICYESIFGDEVRLLAKSGADVLVNVSDDGWYGDSSAPWEHLDMVRMRAIENDRWILRATNTGVTTVVDPHGRVGAELPRHVRGAISEPFSFSTVLTFYTLHGDWIGWLCAAIVAAMLLFGFRQRTAVH